MTSTPAADLELGAHAVVLASVLLPTLIAAAQWATNPPRDRVARGAIGLATLWNAVWLLVLNVVAVNAGWWSFGEAGPTLAGVPVALWIGWTVLWGPVAAQSPLRPSATLALLALADLVYMPLGGAAVRLHGSWLVGEAIALAFVAWPGILLARWSRRQTHLRWRVVMQTSIFAVLLVWLIPVLATSPIGTPLRIDLPFYAYGAVLVVLAAAALPGLIAVHEFFLAEGTPWPWETTSRPVRSGPYRFLRSPMQASGVYVLVVMTVLYREPLIGIAILSAVAYSRIFCSLEATDLSNRFGPRWSELALGQRRWVPTLRPSPHGEPATVWVNLGCDVCTPIARFLTARHPEGLVIRSAVDHADNLRRIRYERADGISFDGVAAVGACLEHLHLGWAAVGWMLRLPGARAWWQLIGDAVGFGPRPALPAAARPSVAGPVDTLERRPR